MIPFHRVLITTGIVFCGGFALWALWRGQMVLGIGFAALGAGLTYYLRHLRRFRPVGAFAPSAGIGHRLRRARCWSDLLPAPSATFHRTMNQHIDLIYFLSSLVLVALPLGVFSRLTYLVVNAYRRDLRAARKNPR